MITKLTQEQENQIPVYLERFRAYGLSTERINQDACITSLTKVAEYQKLPSPQFMFVDSPTQVAIAAALVNKIGVTKTREIVDQGKVLESINLVSQSDVQSQASMLSYGSFDAYWASFYCFVAQQLDVKCDELHQLVEDVVKNCGVFATFEGLYIVSDRAVNLCFNENRELHNEHGMAQEYKDGTGVYAFEGTRLPAWLFEVPKDQIDVRRVLGIQNATVRLVAQKFLGMDKFLDALGYAVIDVDPNEEGAELIEIDMGPEFGKQRFMKMVNPSTGEIHVERVKVTDQTTTDGWKTRLPDYILDKYGFELPKVKA